MRKKLAGLIIAMTAMAAMAACGNSGASQAGAPAAATATPEPVVQESAVETPVPETPAAVSGEIYLILPTETGLSAQEEAVIMGDAKKEGYQVTVKTSEGDTAKQTEAFDAAIAAKAAMIICDNVDNDATTASIQKAREAGIPTILMNRGIESQESAVSQILTDRKPCIARFAEIFADHMGKTGNYAIVHTSSNTDTAACVAAFAEAMKGVESMTAADQIDVDEYNIEAVKESIRQLLANKPEISALVCGNGVQARAASEVAEELEKEMAVFCLDGNDDAISTMILSGKIAAAIVKPSEDIARSAIRDAIAYLKNGATGTNANMYYVGAILTQKETILVVSPTPAEGQTGTPTPIPSATAAPDDSLTEIELDDSDTSGADTSEEDYSEPEVDENGREPGSFEVEIIDESFDEGGEGRPQ